MWMIRAQSMTAVLASHRGAPLGMCLFTNILLLSERMGYSDRLNLGHTYIFGAMG